MKKTILTSLVGLSMLSASAYLWLQDQKSEHQNTAYENPLLPGEPGFEASNSQGLSKSKSVLASASSENIPKQIEREVLPENLVLWNSTSQETLVDGHPAYVISVDEGNLDRLNVEQTLDLTIPHTKQTLQAEIESTHNSSANVHVWKGRILKGNQYDNIIIVRGKIETHITVATEDGTYIAIIDNATGRGNIVDQSDINAGQAPFDDGIHVEPIEVEPPVLSLRGDSHE